MTTGNILTSNGNGVGSWGCVDKPTWDSTKIVTFNLDNENLSCRFVYPLD